MLIISKINLSDSGKYVCKINAGQSYVTRAVYVKVIGIRNFKLFLHKSNFIFLDNKIFINDYIISIIIQILFFKFRR
jgi:hypothetical protein